MGTLEDQLKQWQKTSAPPATSPPAKGASSSRPSSPAPLSKRAAKKKPLLQTIRRDEPVAPTRGDPPPPPPKPLSDADLFALAIEGVSADAVLDKFAAAPTVKVRGQTLQPSAPKTEAELFADFVGTVLPKGAPSPKKR